MVETKLEDVINTTGRAAGDICKYWAIKQTLHQDHQKQTYVYGRDPELRTLGLSAKDRSYLDVLQREDHQRPKPRNKTLSDKSL
eukprot:2910439-Amphidinium_carterae.1